MKDHMKVELESYVVHHIDEAIEKQYIKVYYQPVIRTINGSLCSMEALVRWDDPVHGLLTPADFLPILKKYHLITKIDFYVLQFVCKEMRRIREAGYVTIPVSVNLSKEDFLSGDFLKKIEDIIQQYDIARDMIYLEITEAMIQEEPEILKTEINRLREAGYQIWLDDFGSGYSSFLLLEEYDFDEIKLDMTLLHTLDDKTKRLIRSLISMAKELHIKTLAKCVETQEQYDFLREVGCEKVQGYLCGMPVCSDELAEVFLKYKDRVETRLWHKYYSKVGEINFFTDRALAIVDYDGIDFHYLYSNKEYREVWQSIGVKTMKKVYDFVNSKSSPLWEKYRNFIKTLQVGDDFKQLEYCSCGQFIRVRAKLLYQEQEHRLLQTELINLTREEEAVSQEQIDDVFRIMYGMYDSVYVFKMNDSHHIQTMIPSANHKSLVLARNNQEELPTGETVANLIIHREDREEFCQFIDFSTIVDRIDKQEKNYITEMFRTKAENGAYVWKLHTLLLVPGSDYLIYSSRYVPRLQEQLENKLKITSDAIPDNGIEREVWKALMDSQMTSVFWKDKERRFIGANAKFLETFDMKDESEVLGKRDEDMNWHVDNEPFREDEMRVLEKGEPVVSRLGKCIIKGVAHNILAMKEPVYQNEDIVGLVGTFLNIDELTDYLGMPPISNVTDELTGLMSAQGISNLATEYMESWEFHGRKFAVLTIIFEEYKRAEQTYGEVAAQRILRKVAKLITGTGNKFATVGRIYDGNFVLLARYKEKSEIVEMEEKIRNRCMEIHEIAGYDVTLNPIIKVFYAEDSDDLSKLLSDASSGFHVDLNRQKYLEEELRENQIQMDTLVNAIPGGIVLYEIVDGQLRLTYASEGIYHLMGYTLEEFKSIMQPDEGYGVLLEDYELAQAKVIESISTGTELNVTFRGEHKDGHLIWLKVQGRIVGSQNGHPLLMAVYQNISEMNQVFEKIINSGMEGVIIRDIHTKDILYENAAVKKLARSLFDGSTKAIWTELLGQHDDEKSHEIQYGQRYLNVSLLRSVWHGRDCEIGYIVDLTIQHQQQERAKDILAHVPAAIAVFAVSDDNEVRRVYLSEQARKYAHVPASNENTLDELVSIIHPEDRALVKEVAQKSIIEKSLMDVEFRCFGEDGDAYWNRLITMPHIQADGTYLLYGVYSDVTELKRRTAELEVLSHTDGLTGLKNRHALREDFNSFIHDQVTMFMMDIDHFKYFNDTFGHDAGDRVICVCAEAIQHYFGDCECYRYGGDEFLIIAHNKELEMLQKRMDEMIKVIREKDMGENFPSIEISYGALTGRTQTKAELREILKKADNLLYETKARRRNS